MYGSGTVAVFWTTSPSDTTNIVYMLSSTNGKQASGRCAKLPFDCPCIPPHTAVPNRAVSCHVRLTPKKEERKKTKARRSRGARHVHVLYHAMQQQQRPFRSRLNRLPSRCSIDAFHWALDDGDGRREASALGDGVCVCVCMCMCMCMCMGAPPSAHTTLDGWTTSGSTRIWPGPGQKNLGPGAGRSWPHDCPMAWPRSRGGKLGIV